MVYVISKRNTDDHNYPVDTVERSSSADWRTAGVDDWRRRLFVCNFPSRTPEMFREGIGTPERRAWIVVIGICHSENVACHCAFCAFAFVRNNTMKICLMTSRLSSLALLWDSVQRITPDVFNPTSNLGKTAIRSNSKIIWMHNKWFA